MPQQQNPYGQSQMKEQAYNEFINPLVQTINQAALLHDIPYVVIFQTDDGQYVMSYFTPKGSAEELHGLVKWVQEH